MERFIPYKNQLNLQNSKTFTENTVLPQMVYHIPFMLQSNVKSNEVFQKKKNIMGHFSVEQNFHEVV